MSIPLSVAYVSMILPAASEVFLAVEINALRRAGVNVEIFCLRGKDPRYEQLIVDQGLRDLRIHYTPYVLSWRPWKGVWYWLWRRPLVGLHTAARTALTCWRRPKLLAQSMLILPKSFYIAREIDLRGIRTVHAAWGHHPGVTGYLVKRLMPQVGFTLALGAYDLLSRHPMTPVAAEIADVVLTQSEESAQVIRSEWPKPSTEVVVIARGVDLESTKCFRGDSGNDELIVSSGRLLKAKGHQHVIRALALVRRTYPRASLIILGEGPYRRELEGLISQLQLESAVHLAGHLDQAQAFRCVSRARVFVLASESENLPNSVKEAMAMGVPVVTTDTTGMRELVRDAETGYIVDNGDVQGITEKILAVLDDPGRAVALTERAKALVAARFDLRQTTRHRRELFKALVERYELHGGVDGSGDSFRMHPSDAPIARGPRRELF